MLDLVRLQFLAQMIDDMDIAAERLEKAYANNDGESFQNYRKSILDIHKKITELISTEKNPEKI